MERSPVPSDFVGKTIARIDTRSINLWRFYFTDGSAIAIEAELSGPAGLPEMLVCDECAMRTPDDSEYESDDEMIAWTQHR